MENKNIILKRVYFFITLSLWFAVPLIGLGYLKELKWTLLGLAILFPFIVPTLSMTLSLFAFRFDYSSLGSKTRTEWPDEPMLYEENATSGSVGTLRGSAPFFSFCIFESGLGMSIFLGGKGFIKKEEIVNVKKSLFSCTVQHNSKEVRSPIKLHSKKLYEHILILNEEEKTPNKTNFPDSASASPEI